MLIYLCKLRTRVNNRKKLSTKLQKNKRIRYLQGRLKMNRLTKRHFDLFDENPKTQVVRLWEVKKNLSEIRTTGNGK